MTELRRWLDEGNEDASDELVRDLLRAADEDVPDEQTRARMLAMLAPAAAAGAIAATTASATVAAHAGKLFGIAWKWWAVFALTSALAGWGVVAARAPDAPRPSGMESPVVATQAGRGAASIERVEPPPELAPADPASAAPVAPIAANAAAASAASVASAAPLGAGDPATLKKVVPAPSTSAKVMSLAEETALLDEARTALDARNPARALAALDRYDREAKQRALGPEATMVRIEALHAKGDDNAARKLGKRFLAQHPGSTYEDRVKTLIGDVAR